MPTNTYLCSDGKYVIIGGNADSIFRRLMAAAGKPEMGEDPRLADNAGRVAHQEEVDRAISEWTATLDSVEVLKRLEDAEVPCGPIYSVADLIHDPQFNARGMFERVSIGDFELKVPAIPPILQDTPGRTEWPGPEVGAHNAEVFGELLGLEEKDIEALKAKGIV